MPRPDPPGIKRRKNKSGDKASATTRIYALNVNYGRQTDWSAIHDPHGLQKQVYPILEAWFQDGTFKMNVIRAVLAYAEQLPDQELVLLAEKDRILHQQTRQLGDSIIQYLQKNLRMSSHTPQTHSPAEDLEEDEFLRKMLRYEE